MKKRRGYAIMGGVAPRLGNVIAALKANRAAAETIDAAAGKDDAAQKKAAELFREVRESTRGFDDAPGVQDLRAICGERYGTELRLESVLALRGEYHKLTGKSLDDADETRVVHFVAALREAAAPIVRIAHDDDRWCSVSEAEAIYGIHAATISRAASEGKIKNNGEKGRKRRLDRADLKRWAKEKRPELGG